MAASDGVLCTAACTISELDMQRSSTTTNAWNRGGEGVYMRVLALAEEEREGRESEGRKGGRRGSRKRRCPESSAEKKVAGGGKRHKRRRRGCGKS